jgi:hypothetical protein
VEIKPGFFRGRAPVAAFGASNTLHGLMLKHDPEKWKPVFPPDKSQVSAQDQAQPESRVTQRTRIKR